MGRNARTTKLVNIIDVIRPSILYSDWASRTLSAAPTVAARTHHNETFKTCSPWPSAPGPSCSPGVHGRDPCC